MGTWQYPSCYDRAVKFNSGGNAQDAKYTSHLRFYYGPYQSIDDKEINGDAKISLKKGEGLTSQLEFDYYRFTVDEQYHQVVRLFPEGLTVTGNPGSILRGSAQTIKSIIQAQSIKLPVQIERKVTGKITISDNNEFEINNFAGKISNAYTSTKPVNVPGYGVVILETSGNANFEMVENNGSIISFASGNVLANINTSALGNWHAMASQPWPITQSGGIVKGGKNKEKTQDSDLESFISEISMDYGAEIAAYRGDEKVVAWFEKGAVQQTGNIFIKYYDGSGWSDKIDVDVEPDFAYAPKVAMIDDKQAIIVYVANSESYTPATGPMDSLIKNLELHYTLYDLEDKSIILQRYITDNYVADLNHNLIKDISGELHLFWQTADESITGTQNSPISIKYLSEGTGLFALWENESLTLMDGLTDIKEWNASAYDDNNVTVAYAKFLEGLNKTDIYYKQMVDSVMKPVENVLTEDKNNSSLHLFYDTFADPHIIFANDSTIDHRPLEKNIIHHFSGIESFSGEAYNSFNAQIRKGSGIITVRMNNKIMYSENEDVAGGTWSRFKVLDSAATDVTSDIFVDDNGVLNLIAAKADTGSTPGKTSHTAYHIQKDIFNFLDVKETTASNKVSIFPNPADRTVSIDLSRYEGSISKIEITDLSGRTYKDINNINSAELNIDVSSLSTGHYNILLHNNKNVESKKLLISR